MGPRSRTDTVTSWREDVRDEHLVESTTSTVCPWKGVAHYYSVVAGGQLNPDAAWYYPNPSPLARKIKRARGVLAWGAGGDHRARPLDLAAWLAAGAPARP